MKKKFVLDTDRAFMEMKSVEEGLRRGDISVDYQISQPTFGNWGKTHSALLHFLYEYEEKTGKPIKDIIKRK